MLIDLVEQSVIAVDNHYQCVPIMQRCFCEAVRVNINVVVYFSCT